MRKGQEHKANECKNNFFCQVCNRPGHIASTCQSLNKNIGCQICKRTGHSARNCFFFAPVQLAQPTNTCRICKKPGHTAAKCLQNVTCYSCYEKGHCSYDCKKNSLRLKCGRKGHQTSECGLQYKFKKSLKSCKFCNKSGHDIQNCFLENSHEKFVNSNQGNSRSLPIREATNKLMLNLHPSKLFKISRLKYS